MKNISILKILTQNYKIKSKHQYVTLWFKIIKLGNEPHDQY